MCATRLREHGIRNALLTSIAPTGTISLYAGNVSSGIEPVFAYAYTRKVLQNDGSRTEEEVVDYAVQLWRDKFGDAPLPELFRQCPDAGPVGPCEDAGGGSEMGRQFNFQNDQRAGGYQLRRTSRMSTLEAYATGCKGCTTYRPNEVTG
jgi:ribonucleoside-diphosphate reductase alpha chain